MAVLEDYGSNRAPRRNKRKPFSYPAMIDMGGLVPHACSISDMTNTGAKITLQSDAEVPEQFTLLFSANGSIHRRCHRVWQEGRVIGVEFLRSPAPEPPAAA